MKLTIIRFGYLPDCTLGWWYIGDRRFAVLDDAWRPDPDGPGGQRRELQFQESCVPDGTYRLVPHSGNIKNVWAMVNHGLGVYHYPGDMPAGQKYGRSACLIHGGNSADAVLGCIAVGLNHDIVNGKHWVSDSQVALNQVRGLLGLTLEHELQIRPVAGTAEKL